MNKRNLRQILLYSVPGICFADDGNTDFSVAAPPASDAGPTPEPAAPVVDEAEASLRFDPFSGDAPIPAKAVSAEPTPPADGGTPAPDPAPVMPPPAVDPVVAELKGLREALTTPPPAAAPAETPKEDAPRFAVSVSQRAPQIVTGLASEDLAERGAALDALVNGVANMIWAAVEESQTSKLTELRNSVPGIVMEQYTARQSADAIERQFYGKYPELNNPILKPAVIEAAKAVVGDWKATGKAIPAAWTEEYGDAIAAKMVALGFGRPGAPAPAPAPRQQANFVNGSRPAPDVPNDIMDTLFGN